MLDIETLISNYVEFYERYDRFPEDAEEFTSHLGLDDNEFLRKFNPMGSLEAYIWEGYFDEALESCQQDPEFENYAAREVYLSLLYSLIRKLDEHGKMNREMLSFTKSLPSVPRELRLVKKSAEAFFDQLIKAGQESGEVASRPLVNFQYKKWCWWGLLFIIFFWKNDEGDNSEATDVAIDKVAHLLFDMLNPNAMDSSLEFFTFLFKQGFK
ncbi:MAG: hypothetical protein GY751_00925 [Bacteroidetes bacterium]|nr:hypothetical protein [Bacteroidota bacterium]